MGDIFAKRYRDRFWGLLAYVDTAVLPHFCFKCDFIGMMGLDLFMRFAYAGSAYGGETDRYMAPAPFFGRPNC
jgi:hypothetical protein